MLELVFPKRAGAGKEHHMHRCAIHHRGKCRPTGKCQGTCYFDESNEICGKSLKGSGLDFHWFPCISCQTLWRGQWGGDQLVDAMIDVEQAARHAHVVPDQHLDEREEEEARTNPDVEDLVRATKQI